MIGRFHMATLEPPDDAAWHLAADHYETSGDMDEDALDWLSDADCDDEQKDALLAAGAKYSAVFDMLANPTEVNIARRR